MGINLLADIRVVKSQLGGPTPAVAVAMRAAGLTRSPLLATGYWLLATGYWLLATGYWLLAIGYWLWAAAE